jgi:leader peptidase (prepilin peptidase)/N-methyltransferase
MVMRAAAVSSVFLAAATALILGATAVLPAALVFTVASCVLAAVDLRDRRLPRQIVFPALGAIELTLIAAAVATGEPRRLIASAIGACAAFSALLIVHLASPEGLGFGDVTYALLIGATLGWFGLARVGLGLLLGFVAGALVAGPLAVLRQDRHTTFPFGPALALGAWVALCFGDQLAHLTLTR